MGNGEGTINSKPYGERERGGSGDERVINVRMARVKKAGVDGRFFFKNAIIN